MRRVTTPIDEGQLPATGGGPLWRRPAIRHWLRKYPVQLLVCVALSVVVGSVLVLLVGENPVEVYAVVLRETFFDSAGLMIAIQRATPLILTASAAAVAFRAGAINMGLAGQFAVGAAVAAIAGYGLDLPRGVQIPVVLLLCALGGAAAALIPAIFRALSGVSEVITGMIANMLIPHLLSMVIGFFPVLQAARGGASREGIRASARFLQFAELTDGRVGAGTQANTGIFVAIGVTLALAVWMRVSKLGYEFRVTKLNSRFAEAGGIRAGRYFFLGMLLSGAVAAIGGATEALGVWRSYRLNTMSVGTEGLVMALIGRQSFVGSLVAGLFFGGLQAGAMRATWATSLSRPLVDILVELTIIFAALPSMRTLITGDPESEVDRLGGRFVPRR